VFATHPQRTEEIMPPVCADPATNWPSSTANLNMSTCW